MKFDIIFYLSIIIESMALHTYELLARKMSCVGTNNSIADIYIVFLY